MMASGAAAVEPILYGPEGTPLQRTTAYQWGALFDRERRWRTETIVQNPYAENTWVYSCVTQIALAFAQIRLGLWRRVPGAVGRRPGYVEVDAHRVLERWAYPNRWMDGFTFKAQWITFLVTGGNVWMYPDEPDSYGIPSALYVFGRDHVQPNYDSQGRIDSWSIRPTLSAPPVTVPYEALWHWRLPHTNGRGLGLDPLSVAALTVDADCARLTWDKAFFDNSATPSSVLTYKPGLLGKDQRQQIRESFDEYHRGPARAGRMAVIGGDFDLKVLSIEHSQAQFIDSRKLSREGIAAVFFGFPVGLLNAQEHTGLSKDGLDVARKILYENCVIPFTQQFLLQFNQRYVYPIDPRLDASFDTDLVPVLLKDDYQAKSQIFERFVRNGIPINQAIKTLDLNFPPVDGGDDAFVIGTPTPLGAPPAGPSAAGARWRRAYRALEPIRAAARTVIDRRLLLRVASGEAAATETWMRGLVSMVGWAMRDGLEGDQAPGERGPFLEAAEAVGFSETQLQQAAVGLVERGLQVVEEWRTQARDRLTPDRLARYLLRYLPVWAVNAGRQLGGAGPWERWAPPEGCTADHTGCDYPGDHAVPWEMVANCQCLLGRVEDEADEHEDTDVARALRRCVPSGRAAPDL